MKALSTLVGSAILVLAAIAAAALSGAGQPQPDGGLSRPAAAPLLRASLAQIPLHIIENRGVHPEPVRFYVAGRDKAVFFAPDGITFVLHGDGEGWAVKLEFVGASEAVRLRSGARRQAVFSYFQGPRESWKTGLPSFGEVVYEDLWPGIDLVYRAEVGALKYEFRVQPGADPGRIRLRYSGATSLRITAPGALRVATPAGSFEDAPPVAWQDHGGQRVPVGMRYRLDAAGGGDGAEFGFDLDEYDRTRPLLLDPAVLVYCGYIGGAKAENGLGIAVDAQGCAYIAGVTLSIDGSFPLRIGPDLTPKGQWKGFEAFVAKVNSSGTALIYCGYITGDCGAVVYGIDVDSAGCAYVVGNTGSDENSFPVKVGPGLAHYGLGTDAFIAKVNAQGTGLVYCGYIGGKDIDRGYGVRVDASGSAYVMGETQSPETTFPVKVGPDLTHNGWLDIFVAKVNPQGTGLVYCGYIGGLNDDSCRYSQCLALDAQGCAYVTGWTYSDETTFPVKTGPDQTYNGRGDAFIAKVAASGQYLEYCGYIGGSDLDWAAAVAVDKAGHAYVTGATLSTERSQPNPFPTQVGPAVTANGFGDAFVVKVKPDGSGFVYAGFIGGSEGESGHAIALDALGRAHVVGMTDSDERSFPVTDALDATFNSQQRQGHGDGFVAVVEGSGAGLVRCGYLGGAKYEAIYGIALDRCGNAYVTGSTASDERSFPVRVGPDLTYNDVPPTPQVTYGDAFVAKIAHTDLTLAGSSSIGGSVTLHLASSNDGGLLYRVGSALGTGPIPVDQRRIDLSPDGLLVGSVGGLWPGVFAGYQGVMDGQGAARAVVHIPNASGLIGTRVYSAYVTLDAAASSGVRSISQTRLFSITR